MSPEKGNPHLKTILHYTVVTPENCWHSHLPRGTVIIWPHLQQPSGKGCSIKPTEASDLLSRRIVTTSSSGSETKEVAYKTLVGHKIISSV